ncbi:MAG TPA: sulfate/thiosulfate ABC transporter permease CysW, partial [Inquilinus sp.]|nr:sulfate/thiosulfate ABC transporter permease CysW [Inquilinus sp.]
MGGLTRTLAAARTRLKPAQRPWEEPFGIRFLLIAISVLFLGVFLVLPLAVVLTEAMRKGVDAYLEGIGSDDSLAAIRLTLTVAAIAVPLNTVFGLATAWAIAKFEFPGKS